MEFKVPFSRVLDRDKYNALEDVKKLHTSLILIAGELDEIVLPGDVKKIYENANEPKRFVNIPKIGHDYRHNEPEINLVNEKILEQLDSF